ncbi:MAG: hypothetical protein WCD53_04820 [Microcoleus sp.]
MKYTLNFSLKLEMLNSCIVYNPEAFAETPISISVPDVVKIFEHFIKTFKEFGITEQPANNTIPSEEKTKDTTAVTGLSAKAYICHVPELDDTVLTKFCTELTEYLQKCCSEISKDFLSEKVNVSISGLREVIELRNYLARYTQSEKKAYQNGYLYIMVL